MSTAYISQVRRRAGRPARGAGDPSAHLERLAELAGEITRLARSYEATRAGRNTALVAALSSGVGLREAARLAAITPTTAAVIRDAGPVD